jgi:hypothetical protein
MVSAIRKRPGRCEQSSHTFRDPGKPIAEIDYTPRAVHREPVHDLALIFVRLGRDYGGMISPQPEEPR